MATAVLLAAGLLLYELDTARDRLVAARTLLRQATSNPESLADPEGRATALAAIDRAIATTEQARDGLRSSVVLSGVRGLPGLSGQRAGLLSLTEDGARAATLARDLLRTADELADSTVIVDGKVPVGSLEELASAMGDASRGLATIDRNESGLWGPLREARHEFDDLVADGVARLRGGSDALSAGLTFMGADRPRTHLVAIQNNAEMRAQGMVLSYAVVTFADGQLSFDTSGSVAELALQEPVATALPQGTEEIFGPLQPTQLWHSVNATADFALSGRIMADMFEAATGQRIDGVIGVDVPALALLLAALGPVQVPDIPTPITAANVGDVLLHDIYQGVPQGDDPERREKLGDVTEAVIGHLTTGGRNGVQIGLRLADAARGLHLRLWSGDPGEEEVFERTGLGGGPAAENPFRTFHVAVENRTATKLDYYVKTTVRHDVKLTDAGDAVISTTVVIDNQAPPDGEPSYQLGPDRVQSRPGEYHGWLLLWSPAGSEVPVSTVEDSGLLLSQRVVVVDPGTRREIQLPAVTIPDAVQDGRLQLRLVPQPRLDPPHLEVRLAVEGWTVSGDTSWSGPWDRVVRMEWEVRR